MLDIPNGPLDPKGFTSVEVVLHGPAGDVTRTADLSGDGSFDLGAIDPDGSVSVEATLRSNSGAPVGYGRTALAAALAGGTEIVVPMRRPIAYIAGTVGRDADNDGATPALHWTLAPATYSDLSVGGSLDGKSQLGRDAVMMIAAGPDLYMVTQATSDPDGALTGPAKVAPVSADHEVRAALAGSMTGAVLDGAGSDDGRTLVIGTTTQLFAVDAMTGAVASLAKGSFARVALVMSDTGELGAVAISRRGATTGPCSATAELWWATLVPGATEAAAHLVATGGFSDIAADRGRAYYVDACKGELGEVTASAVTRLRTIAGTGAGVDPGAGRLTAIAVSNGQAYLGVETPPATTALLVAAVNNADPPRTLWSEAAQQVLEAVDFAGVQRQLDATSAVFSHLEVGSGGDYVALTTTAHFEGIDIIDANFPKMTIDTEELRVFDAATGGVVQRYRSWCDGLIVFTDGDIEDWQCASTAGQTEAADFTLEHHINSMTFLFGKK